MILVDTSVWIDHFRKPNSRLRDHLELAVVLAHPFVIGEVALGSPPQRELLLGTLSDLPVAQVARDVEVLEFIARHSLFSRGIGYVDIHLLAAVRLTPEAALWTIDRKLRAVATELGLAFE